METLPERLSTQGSETMGGAGWQGSVPSAPITAPFWSLTYFPHAESQGNKVTQHKNTKLQPLKNMAGFILAHGVDVFWKSIIAEINEMKRGYKHITDQHKHTSDEILWHTQ